MWPTLISLGPLSIHSFGVLLFLGFFFGGFQLWQKARENGWEETAVMDSWLTTAVAAAVAARVGYILLEWQEFAGNWYKILFFTKFPGWSGSSAWLGAIAALVIFARKKQWPLVQWLEAVSMAIVTAEIFLRFGQFFAGSGLGRPAPAGFGLNFPGVDSARWPVQIFWGISLIALSRLLIFLEQHYRSYGLKSGFLISVYLLVNGLLTIGFGFLETTPRWWWGAGLILTGGLILAFSSGINFKAEKKPPSKPVRKKRGFDYV